MSEKKERKRRVKKGGAVSDAFQLNNNIQPLVVNSQLQQTITNIQNNDDHIYLDLVVSNLQSVDTKPPAVNFTMNTVGDFLKSPENYNLSIISWSLQTLTLPIMTCQAMLASDGNTDPNKTIYSITLSYGAYDFQQYLTFIPQNKSSPVPSVGNNSELYYNLYSKQYFIMLVNNTFQAAYDGLLALAGSLPSDYAPVMSINVENSLCTINADIAAYDTASSSPYISIYMNPAMFSLFNSFPSEIQSYISTNTTKGKNFKILTNIDKNISVTPYPAWNPINGLYFLQCNGEYDTATPNWNPVSSIQFISNNLPIKNATVISTPTVFNNGVMFDQNTNASNLTANIITDFVSDGGQYTPSITYVPQSEYRLIPLGSGQNLRQINFQIFYTDKGGSSYPLLLASNSTCTMKCLFRSKGFNSK